MARNAAASLIRTQVIAALREPGDDPVRVELPASFENEDLQVLAMLCDEAHNASGRGVVAIGADGGLVDWQLHRAPEHPAAQWIAARLENPPASPTWATEMRSVGSGQFGIVHDSRADFHALLLRYEGQIVAEVRGDSIGVSKLANESWGPT